MPLPDLALLDRSAEPALRAKLDGKAKPPGALGRIEDLAVTLALIQGRPDPCVDPATLLVLPAITASPLKASRAIPPR